MRNSPASRKRAGPTFISESGCPRPGGCGERSSPSDHGDLDGVVDYETCSHRIAQNRKHLPHGQWRETRNPNACQNRSTSSRRRLPPGQRLVRMRALLRLPYPRLISEKRTPFRRWQKLLIHMRLGSRFGSGKTVVWNQYAIIADSSNERYAAARSLSTSEKQKRGENTSCRCRLGTPACP